MPKMKRRYEEFNPVYHCERAQKLHVEVIDALTGMLPPTPQFTSLREKMQTMFASLSVVLEVAKIRLDEHDKTCLLRRHRQSAAWRMANIRTILEDSSLSDIDKLLVIGREATRPLEKNATPVRRPKAPPSPSLPAQSSPSA
jgi:hypothetical protein